MKKVFIRGNEERGSEVIKMLEDLGGVNNSAHEGAYESNLYYVNHVIVLYHHFNFFLGT